MFLQRTVCDSATTWLPRHVAISAATGYFAKIARFTKNSLDLTKNSRFKICVLKLTVLLEIIYSCTLTPFASLLK